jgi:hypothetical protein
VALVNAPGNAPARVATHVLSTLTDLDDNWRPIDPKPSHPLERFVGTYVDRVGALGTVRVQLEDGHLALDVLEAPGEQRAPSVRFEFDKSSPNARYLVTPLGIGHRSEAHGEDGADTNTPGSRAPG